MNENAIPIDGLTRLEWLELRRQGIGSSDAPAIAGFDRWRSPYAVWVSKIEPAYDDGGSDATEWGNRLEEAVAQKFADDTGLAVVRPSFMYRHSDHHWMLASPDRFVNNYETGEVGLLEIKTTGSHLADDWSDGPPAKVRVQVQHQLAVTGLTRAWIAVLIGGRDYRPFELARDDDDIAAIIAVEHAFWHDHVLSKIPPPIDGTESTSDAIRALYERVQPGVETDLDATVAGCIDVLRHTRALIKDLESDERRLENVIKAALADAEIGLVDGKVAVTWKQSTSKRIDVERLRSEYPEIAAEMTTESTARRFLLKGNAR